MDSATELARQLALRVEKLDATINDAVRSTKALDAAAGEIGRMHAAGQAAEGQQDALAAAEQGLREAREAESHLNKKLAMTDERISRGDRHRATRRDESSAAFQAVRTEREAFEAESAADREKAKADDAVLANLAARKERLREDHTREMAAVEMEKTRLVGQLGEYHASLSAAMTAQVC